MHGCHAKATRNTTGMHWASDQAPSHQRVLTRGRRVSRALRDIFRDAKCRRLLGIVVAGGDGCVAVGAGRGQMRHNALAL
jgi:hypothetical protein